MREETDDIVRLARAFHGEGRVSIRRMGSFVNDVFLVKVDNDSYVAKRYTNWLSLKWFTLSLYGLGSVRFSISGRRRMESEYYFNDFLRREGVRVPKILGSDSKARVILFKYVHGEQILARIARVPGFTDPDEREMASAFKAGALISRAHELEVALGDTRPENFLVDGRGQVTLVDLEQARHNGDFAWDVAEFLFFSGHYWIFYRKAVEGFFERFISGYLEKGDVRVLRSAASPKFLRVFAIWTPPNILHNARKLLLKYSSP